MDGTVIIPTYNRPKLLANALACLTVQDGGLREVLVCDDGSTPSTAEVVRGFEGRIPGLRFLRQADQGFRAGQARNMGIEVATGSHLIFVDDDVLLPQNFVASHLEAHARGSNGSNLRQVILGFRYRTSGFPSATVPTREAVLRCNPDDRVEELGPQGERIVDHPHAWFLVYSCNFSVPNDPDVRFDDDFVGWGMEDIELGYRLAHHGFRVRVEPNASVLHNDSPEPRDPFVCENQGLPPFYDTYIVNMVRFLDKYPNDLELRKLLLADLRWYLRDPTGEHWIKDGHEHDPLQVIRAVRGGLDGAAASKLPTPRRVAEASGG